MSIYVGEPAELQESAKATGDRLEDLTVLLGRLSGVQDELHAAVVSRGAGEAIYNTLGNAHERGKSLAGTLANILTELNHTGVTVEADDLESASQVTRAMNGGDWVGNAAGMWSDGQQQAVDAKVDTKTW